MKNVLTGLILLLCLACATGTSRLIDKEKLNFSYTDDAYLFFRNMRQAQYNRTVMEKEGLRLYQHEDYSSSQFIRTQLVVNWKVNSAYMLLDFADSTEKYDIKIYIREEDQSYSEIAQENLRRQGELVFLTDLYNHLLQEDKLFYELRYGQKTPLFETLDDQEAFRISMYDYYRLTAVL